MIPAAFIPRHPTNSLGTIPGDGRWITLHGSSRRQIRSKPWTDLPLESTRAQPRPEPRDGPGVDPPASGTPDVPAPLGFAPRAPGVLRFAPHPLRRASLPRSSDLRVLRGALRRCARYSLRVAATLSARAPTRATRRFAPRHAPSPSARFPSRREAAFGSLLFRFMEVFRQVVPRVHARGSGGVWPAVSPTPRGSDPSALRFATHLLSRFR